MKTQTKSSLLMSALTILSLFCIGLGLISVISANWRAIPDEAKLGADLLLLGIVAFGAVRAYLTNGRHLTALIFFYALLIAASLGLVVQVFQLNSGSSSALVMLWCGLTLPLLFLKNQLLLPIFWILAFFGAAFDLLYLPLFADQISIDFLPYLFIVALLYRLATQFLKSDSGFVKAFRFWLVFYIVWTFLTRPLFGAEMLDNLDNLSLFGLVAVLWLGIAGLNFVQKQSFLLPVEMAVLALLGLSETFDAGSLVNFGFCLAALTVLGGYAYRANRTKLLTMTVVLAAVRVFVLFLEQFGTLLNTGIFLILAGVLLIAALKISLWLAGSKKHA